MPIPVVGQEPGPDWASDLNNSLSIVDQHDHSAGSGVPVTPSGLNISSDLPFNNNNATALRSARLQNQASLLSLPADLRCLYSSGVDLYFNDGLGNQIRITQSGGVAGTSGSIANLVAPASASYVAASKTFVWQSDANTPANMDNASVILRNLVANSKGLTLAPPNAMGADYTLVLPSLPGVQNIMTLDASGNIGAAWNVDNSTIEVASNIIQVKNQGITTAKIADGNVTQIKMAPMAFYQDPTPTPVGGFGVSQSTANGSSSNPAYVPAVSVTITTTGRPVRLQIASDGGGNSSFITSTQAFEVFFYRDATQIYRSSVAPAGVTLPSSICSTFDYNVPAGTYTYQWGIAATSGGTIQLHNLVLMVYEI